MPGWIGGVWQDAAARVQYGASYLELQIRQCLQGSPALITSIDLLNGTHARDNKSIHNLQGLVRLPGTSRMRLAGKIQPMALGRTNENTEIESERDTWKVVPVEGKRVVSSLALSLPSGVTGKWRWTRASYAYQRSETSFSGCCHWLALQILKANTSLYSVLPSVSGKRCTDTHQCRGKNRKLGPQILNEMILTIICIGMIWCLEINLQGWTIWNC